MLSPILKQIKLKKEWNITGAQMLNNFSITPCLYTRPIPTYLR